MRIEDIVEANQTIYLITFCITHSLSSGETYEFFKTLYPISVTSAHDYMEERLKEPSVINAHIHFMIKV